MEKLDGIVLDAVEQRVLHPARLPKLLEAFLEKSDVSDAKRREEQASLRTDKTNSMGALNRLYELVEQGLASPTDHDFAERLTHHRGRIASLTADIEAPERQLKPNQRAVTPEIIGRFGTLLRDGLRGDNPALRQAYVRLLIDQVLVEDEQIRIRESRKALERVVVATAAGTRKGVPSFAREWRTQHEYDGHSSHWEISVTIVK